MWSNHLTFIRENRLFWRIFCVGVGGLDSATNFSYEERQIKGKNKGLKRSGKSKAIFQSQNSLKALTWTGCPSKRPAPSSFLEVYPGSLWYIRWSQQQAFQTSCSSQQCALSRPPSTVSTAQTAKFCRLFNYRKWHFPQCRRIHHCIKTNCLLLCSIYTYTVQNEFFFWMDHWFIQI